MTLQFLPRCRCLTMTELSNKRKEYMQQALCLAQEACASGEVPVGAIIVNAAGEIIGRGRNRREETGLATKHAEIEAIEQACKVVGDWRLDGCTLYVTLEPCPMCTGAIINSRVSELVYGAKDAETGCCGSVINLFEENLGHHPAVFSGVLGEECERIMKDFFHSVR